MPMETPDFRRGMDRQPEGRKRSLKQEKPPAPAGGPSLEVPKTFRFQASFSLVYKRLGIFLEYVSIRLG